MLSKNEKNLNKFGKFDRHHRGPERSHIFEIPDIGDCWLAALLAQILGFVIDTKDKKGIIRTNHQKMSQIVRENCPKFEDCFEKERELEAWCTKVQKYTLKHYRTKCSSTTQIEISKRITCIVVHVLDLISRNGNATPVQHFLPRYSPPFPL